MFLLKYYCEVVTSCELREPEVVRGRDKTER